MKHPRRLAIFGLALLVLSSVACTGVSKPKGWSAPVDGGDGIVLMHDQRGTISAVRLTDAGSAVLWTFPSKGDKEEKSFKAFYAAPIVDRSGAEPRVIIASYTGQIVSLKLKDGTKTDGWPAEVDVEGAVVATPDLKDGMLYVASGHKVVPVNAITGVVSDPIVNTGDNVWAQPVFDGGALYVGSLDGTLRAVNSDGSERWRANLGGAIAGDMTLEDGVLYVGTLKSRLYAIDVTNGEERWAFEGKNWFWARPLVNGGTVLAPTTVGTVYAIDRQTGEEQWERRAISASVHTTPVLVAGAVVVADGKGNVYGLNPDNGETVWQQKQAGEQFFADPLVLESVVYYLSEDGTLVRVSPQAQGALSVVYERG